MLRISIRYVKQGKEARLRSWLHELNKRAEDVRETFIGEGTRHEQGYLLKLGISTVIVYAMEVDDQAGGPQANDKPELPIELQHRQVMSECVGDRVDAELLYDVALQISS